MKKFNKILSVLLIFPLILSLFACKKQTNETSNFEMLNPYYKGINLNNEIGSFVYSGKTDYVVLLPQDETPALRQAANELVDYAMLISGATLQIVSDETFSSANGGKYFSIGKTKLNQSANLKTDYDSLNGDGFVLKTVGDDVIVDASTDMGYLFGTYEFIEKVMGVRWFASEETYIPQNENIPLYEIDLTSIPAIANRVYMTYPVFIRDPDLAYAAHSRTNYSWLEMGENYGYRHEVYSRYLDTHNARTFVPAEKYAPENVKFSGEKAPDWEPHPELYYLPNGVEHNYDAGTGISLNWLNGITADGKLDESLEISAVKIVIEEMKKDVLANPDAKYFVLEQEDIGTVMPDNDPTVQKYKASGVLVRFCNVVASELKKWADAELNGREVNVVTFAYQQTQTAPLNEKGEPIDKTVIPVDNLYIRLAFTSSYFYPYDDERQGDITKATVKDWSTICSNFWFWGYDACYSDFISYSPTLGQAKGTAQMFVDIGVQSLLMQSTYLSRYDWQSNIKGYVWNKLMWDPEQDVNFLVDEYMKGYYGIAAPYVREMMDLFDTHFAKYLLSEKPPRFWPYQSIAVPATLTPTVLETAVSIIEKGQQAVEQSNLSETLKEKLRVRLARVMVTPKWMMLQNFVSVYPLVDQREQIKLAHEVKNLCSYGSIEAVTEGLNISAYMSSNFNI